ncbi:asparagine synthase (glutamine-hydrolyzing) [Rubinisphaera sp.]|uniref:asparagine synthase (glutamine-hydrolyzing) n=1 Tax=Rubinisphaera sp. TaxID=2024857 RepID=UPI000C0C9E7C|nr:asparagine synthase (glutamine-hydrolyzing) [Rubinisphaera sp.]MBV08981.1 asparagine synthase (glutamine-hydrolyzing) [Rubinisphaera sp.]HCS53926.1 asparagine synthase (glutamine-hydrolyzing) [Planctomycetaceae bacterium]
MCGILGLFAADRQSLNIDDAEVLAMRETMQRRGPDEAGLISINGSTIFAHRRLSIRDPAHGQQPWSSGDQRYTLTYNGELYNVDELHALTAENFEQPLSTRCDTELLMRTLITQGAEGIPHLQGMFAFGFYDAQEHRLILARDRFGIKPLYYSVINDVLVFASSITAIQKHPDFESRPNRRALIHYLMTLRTHFGQETMIEGIKQVPAGCLLRFDESGISIKRYWDYPKINEDLTESETESRLIERFSEAVEKRIVSDVPVGMMLSGGVDSSLLGTYVKETLGEDFTAECGVGQTAEAEEESQFARQAAEFLSCKFDLVTVDEKSYRAGWQELLAQTGQPLATPSDVIIYRLAQSLQQKVGVVLGGEGADELLCGYTPIHGIGRDYDELQRLIETEEEDPEALEYFLQQIESFYGTSQEATLAEMYFALATVFPPPAIEVLIPDSTSDLQRIHKYYQKQLKVKKNLSHAGLQAMTKLLHQENLQSLLSRLDQATMAASLEARVPYTDHQLVEAIWSTPLEHRFKIDDEKFEYEQLSIQLERDEILESKSILRSLARRRLPEELANRRKASFPTPVHEWMQKEWGTWVHNTLTQSDFLKQQFDPKQLLELIENPQRAGMLLWPLLNLALWGEQFSG